MDGVAATYAIKREFPDTLSARTYRRRRICGPLRLPGGGCRRIRLKDAPAARITDAVRRVLAGESPLDEKVAMGLLMSLMNRGTDEESGPEGRIRTPLHFRNPPGKIGGSRPDQLPYAPRSRGPQAGGAGTDQPADRPEPLHQPEHRKEARTPHRREAWRFATACRRRCGPSNSACSTSENGD